MGVRPRLCRALSCYGPGYVTERSNNLASDSDPGPGMGKVWSLRHSSPLSSPHPAPGQAPHLPAVKRPHYRNLFI